MLKAWFVSLLVFLLLAAAIYFNVFEWLASGSARLVGLSAVGIVLIAAFFVLGYPFRKQR